MSNHEGLSERGAWWEEFVSGAGRDDAALNRERQAFGGAVIQSAGIDGSSSPATNEHAATLPELPDAKAQSLYDDIVALTTQWQENADEELQNQSKNVVSMMLRDHTALLCDIHGFTTDSPQEKLLDFIKCFYADVYDKEQRVFLKKKGSDDEEDTGEGSHAWVPKQ